jgi:hypothetical protein
MDGKWVAAALGSAFAQANEENLPVFLRGFEKMRAFVLLDNRKHCR